MDFRILGPLEVEATAGLVRLGSPRERRLLAVLLLNANVVVPGDRLFDAIWEDPPLTARQQLHNLIGALRRTLAQGSNEVRVATDQAGYQICVPEDGLDVHRFRRHVSRAGQAEAHGLVDEAVRLLREALALWRGPALAGLNGNYIKSAVVGLEEERMAAVERLAALRLKLGETTSLVSDLVGLVAEHPLRESLRAALMMALHHSGRQADALAVYDKGRRCLAEELGLDPSPQLRRLHEQILRGSPVGSADVVAAVATTPGGGSTGESNDSTIKARPAGRCFLPRVTSEFAGRTADVGRLVKEIRSAEAPTLVISAIDGMGGIGKTALAVYVAHQLTDEYPDGQYFLDLHGFSDGVDPLTAEDALEMLLLDSGVPAELIPADAERRSALWRSEMAGKRALLLLDNASDAAQVRPLLPGTAGIAVLVTSRRRLAALEGAVPLSLEVLSPDDAIALFAKVAGTESPITDRAAVATAVELCGYLPLAIRIAAARLRDRKSWTIFDLVDQLRNQRRRRQVLAVGDRSVVAALSVSYRYLAPKQRTLFRLLSLHPGPDFDVYAAAAVAGLSLDETAECLEALFDDNLLLQHAPGRYQFHDLIRDCAQHLSDQFDDESTRHAARHRLFDYYLQSANTWCKNMAKGPFEFDPDIAFAPQHLPSVDSDQDGLDRLRSEQRNLTAVAQFAIENGWHQHAWQLVCSLQPFLKLSNYGGNALELFQGAAKAARAVHESRGESASLTGAALALREHRLNVEACAVMDHAISISREIGDRKAELHQLNALGVVKLNQCKFTDAYDCFAQARAIAANVGDNLILTAIANNFGVICLDLGRNDEALEHFETALAFYRTTGDRRSEALALANSAWALSRQRKYQEAITRFDLALRSCQPVGDPQTEALALTGLCAAQRAVGQFDESVTSGRRALSRARRARLLEVECDALSSLGDTFLAIGDFARAKETYLNAKEIAVHHQLILCAARIQEGFAHIAEANGDLAAARSDWEHALRLYPVDAGESEGARRHLMALGDSTVHCIRCEIRTSSPAVA